MTELAKCRCGAAADVPEDRGDYYRIECLGECDFYVSAPTIERVVSAWNDLMRPRPVAEWVPAQGLRGDEPHGFVGSLRLGQVVLGHVSVHGIVAARCHIDGKGQYFLDPDSASARAWLKERVRAAGFEVREEVSDDGPFDESAETADDYSRRKPETRVGGAWGRRSRGD